MLNKETHPQCGFMFYVCFAHLTDVLNLKSQIELFNMKYHMLSLVTVGF